MKRNLNTLALACIMLALIASSAAAQDFQKSYHLSAGGNVSLRNASGNMKITGYDGDAVVVNAFREGRDREGVQIEDLSSGNRVEIRVSYADCRYNCRADVRFDVRLPRGVRLNLDQISTASGNIEVNNVVAGEVRLSTASGDVLVKETSGAIHATTASGEMRVRDASGTVSAQSASGNVEVEIARLEGTDDMKFSSASGDVNVRLPANLDAEVEMSSASGSVKTTFPLQIEDRRYGPGSRARGRVGNGSRRLRVSSASGNVSLTGL